jgi:hypothetical protein
MGMVHQNCREIRQNFWQPVGWNFFAEQKHAGFLAVPPPPASGNLAKYQRGKGETSPRRQKNQALSKIATAAA